jgi:hypothetical protein
MLMPMGPGVDSDTAIMLIRSACVNQLVLSARSLKNGSVAMPPPMANRPMRKNS